MVKNVVNDLEDDIKNTIEKYNLATKSDKVLVACSGGKDSTTVLYVMKKLGYNVEALTINLRIGDYSKKNLENVKIFCEKNKIKLHSVDIKNELGYSMCYIRSLIQSKVRLHNCAICGVLKKWMLNKKARELKATKIATGHNLDDEASTVVMNLFKANKNLLLNIGPKTGILEDKKFVQRIKPLYFSKEKDIKKYSKMMKFPVLYEKCPCATGAFRRNIKNELNKLEKEYPFIKDNFVNIFLEIKEEMIKDIEGKINHCKVCGEPSRRDTCKKCELFELIKSSS